MLPQSAVAIAHSSERRVHSSTGVKYSQQERRHLDLDSLQIIKDLQLLGLVAALVVADVILLVTWVLTDPIQCLQILGVSMKVRASPWAI